MGDKVVEAMGYFKKALDDKKDTWLYVAADVTVKNVETCLKIDWWIEGLWEIIEEFTNTEELSDNQKDFFLAGIARLEEAQR